MATVTKSIGTSSRDYSTITAWEADLDDTNIYTSGDDAVGECYNDSAFDEAFTINGGATVGLNSTKLSVASGERHDGTSGSGVRILSNSHASVGISINISVPRVIEWIEVDVNGYRSGGIYWDLSGLASSAVVQNVILHGIFQDATNGSHAVGIVGTPGIFQNCIVYDITTERSSTFAAKGMGGSGSASQVLVYNSTVHNIVNNNGSGSALGIYCRDASNHEVRNCISTDIAGTSTGSTDSFSATSSAIQSNNLSSDSTASGTGSLTGKTAANQFVSTVSGSEDLHLKTGADAIGAGVDLATSSLDINGSDRNALAATVWDIGAHQFASTASIGSTGRDYSTITLWEADLDDTTIYGAGANAVGECYNDSTFSTNNVIINGGSTVGLSSITLGVATGERHDGTAGTGAILEKDSLWHNLLSVSTTVKTLVTDLEISSTYVTANGVIVVGAYNYDHRFSKLLIYASAGATGAIGAGFWRVVVDNCIMYGSINSGIGTNTYYNPCEFVNNTMYCPNPIGNPGDRTISKAIIKNNIAFSTNATNSINSTGATSHPDWQNNLVNVGPNYGSNQYTETSSANLFVSTVSGSEDLHLNSTSTAIGKGANLSSQAGLSAFNTHPEYVAGFSAIDINGGNRAAFTGNSWDIGVHQYALTASIGTSSRDYSTIAAWEADLDNTAKYGNGSNAVGECYNDSIFTDNNLTINGGGTVGLNSVTLSVNSASRHDGTAGTGATIQCYTGPFLSIANTTVEYLTINFVGTGNYAHSTGLSHTFGISNTYIRNNVVYGDLVYRNNINAAGPGISNQGSNCVTINNIIYNIENPNPSSTGGIGLYNHYNNNKEIYNNTIYRCGVGYSDSRRGTSTSKNNISTGSTRGLDFSLITNYNSTLTASNNLSSDDSADDAGGSGHIINKPASKQFVSTLSGSEDLHLKFISAAIDAGVDLGTTPDGVQYDINGKDRDAENSIWDIGAHEFGDNVVYGLFTVL